MNFTDLLKWATGIVIGWSAIHNIDSIRHEILKAQAKLIYESRTTTWGSPRFFSRDRHEFCGLGAELGERRNCQ